MTLIIASFVFTFFLGMYTARNIMPYFYIVMTDKELDEYLQDYENKLIKSTYDRCGRCVKKDCTYRNSHEVIINGCVSFDWGYSTDGSIYVNRGYQP